PIGEMLGYQSQEPLKVHLYRPDVSHSLVLGANREDVSEHAVVAGCSLQHQSHCLGLASGCDKELTKIVQALGKVGVIHARDFAQDVTRLRQQRFGSSVVSLC